MYHWRSAEQSHTNSYLLPALRKLLPSPDLVCSSRVLDLGCGNGWLSAWLAGQGAEVIGVDPSESGVAMARQAHPQLRFEQLTPDPSILVDLGTPPFDLVLSTEVVEHVLQPRKWAAAAWSALKPGGLLICSTPYHGYLKNLVLAATGKMYAHFTVLWDGGHIKFWSRTTLSTLLFEQGFTDLRFLGAGRVPWLWKPMLISVRKPLSCTEP